MVLMGIEVLSLLGRVREGLEWVLMGIPVLPPRGELEEGFYL